MKLMTPDLESLSIEELEGINNGLSNEREAIRRKQLEINRVISLKTAQAEAARKLALMSDAEREALAQLLSPSGIESQSNVPRVGGR